MVHTRQFTEIKRRAVLALGYPLILLALAALLFVLIMVFFVPVFRAIFDDFQVQLPVVTTLVLAISGVVTRYGWWMLLTAVILLAAGWLAGQYAPVAALRRRVLQRLPLVGRVFQYAAMARFSHLLALLVEEQVPLPEAVILAGSGSDDRQLREAAGRLAQRVAAGDTLAASAADVAYFPASFVQAVRWDQQPDAIPQMLRALAEMFEGQTRDRTAIVAAMCEPVIIVLSGGLVGFLVLGLLLPLLSLITNLSS